MTGQLAARNAHATIWANVTFCLDNFHGYSSNTASVLLERLQWFQYFSKAHFKLRRKGTDDKLRRKWRNDRKMIETESVKPLDRKAPVPKTQSRLLQRVLSEYRTDHIRTSQKMRLTIMFVLLCQRRGGY